MLHAKRTTYEGAECEREGRQSRRQPADWTAAREVPPVAAALLAVLRLYQEHLPGPRALNLITINTTYG